jgi:hypothetical protein
MQAFLSLLMLLAALVGDVKGEQVVLAVKQLITYPGYTGPLAVSTPGLWVALESTTGRVQLGGELHGLEPNSAGGVHIHEGGYCAVAGGHYWTDGVEDAWATSSWTSDMNGFAFLGANTSIAYGGLAQRTTVGRVVVVHDSNKTRVACGLIVPQPRVPSDLMAIGVFPSATSPKPTGYFAGASGSLHAYLDAQSSLVLEGWLTLNSTNARDGDVLDTALLEGQASSNLEIPGTRDLLPERLVVRVTTQLGLLVARASFLTIVPAESPSMIGLSSLFSFNGGRVLEQQQQQPQPQQGTARLRRELGWTFRYARITHGNETFITVINKLELALA